MAVETFLEGERPPSGERRLVLVYVDATRIVHVDVHDGVLNARNAAEAWTRSLAPALLTLQHRLGIPKTVAVGHANQMDTPSEGSTPNGSRT